MRTIHVDDMDDVSHRGHHLDREISNLKLDLEKFHATQRKILESFQNLTLSAPHGYEVVAVFVIHVCTKADTWSSTGSMEGSFQVTPGMYILGSNYMSLWLRDSEHHGVLKLADLSYKTLHESFGDALNEEREGFANMVAHRSTEILLQRLVSKREEVEREEAVLRKLQQEERRIVDLYMCINRWPDARK